MKPHQGARPAEANARILFGRLVPMTGALDDPPLADGEVLIRDGVVQAIHTRRSANFQGDTLDLSGHLLLPGFVNAHAHLTLSGLAGKISRRAGFAGWIQEVVRENEALPADARRSAFRRGAAEMIRSGVTFLVDYLGDPEWFGEYRELPLRGRVFLEVLGFPASRAGDRTRQARAFLEKNLAALPGFSLGLAPHAPYSVSPALFKALRELAGRFDVPLSCHLAETPEEDLFIKEGAGPLRDLLRARGVDDPDWRPPGCGPVRYLDRLGVLDGLQAVHLNHAAEDWDLLTGRVLGGVFCAGSTRWFGRGGGLPVRRLLDAKKPVGLGTDSLASNDSLNFLRELRMAEEMLPEVSRRELLWMATRGGALASGVEAGRLVPGAAADLVAFRTPNAAAHWWDLPFERSRVDPDAVVVRGRRAVKGGFASGKSIVS